MLINLTTIYTVLNNYFWQKYYQDGFRTVNITQHEPIMPVKFTYRVRPRKQQQKIMYNH